MGVSVSVTSKRFECSLVLEHKLSIVISDSGKGKSQLIQRLDSTISSVQVDVTEGYDTFVLTESVFNQYINKAKRMVRLGKYKSLKDYWSDDNFPLENCVIFIDDEDFVIRREFDWFFNADVSNYYVVINRADLSGINYSVSDIFEFCTEGNRHWLRPKYELDNVADNVVPDIVVTEGVGSDFSFISALYENSLIEVRNLGQTGKDSTKSFLQANAEKFKDKRVLLLVDYCAFGSCIDAVFELCWEKDIDVIISSNYLSFEYLILNTTFVNDTKLDEFVRENAVKFRSLERLFTYRLCQLTRGYFIQLFQEFKRISSLLLPALLFKSQLY